MENIISDHAYHLASVHTILGIRVRGKREAKNQCTLSPNHKISSLTELVSLDNGNLKCFFK